MQVAYYTYFAYNINEIQLEIFNINKYNVNPTYRKFFLEATFKSIHAYVK